MTPKIMRENQETIEMLEAMKRASRREEHAIIYGERKTIYIRNEKCYVFKYPETPEFRGTKAIYNTVKRQWLDQEELT